jgi:hypothetical protein
LDFRWEGFQGDGPNAFSVSAQMEIYFDTWQYRLEGREIKFNSVQVYQEWLSEDEQDALISRMAKQVFERIQQQRRKPAQN